MDPTERHDRMRAIEARLTVLEQYDDLTRTQSNEFHDLILEFEQLDREENLERVRAAGNGGGSLRVSEPGDDDQFQPRDRTAGRPRLGGVRGQAMDRLNGLEREGCLRSGLDRYAALLSSDDDQNVDPDEIARYVQVASDPAYFSAFKKAHRAASGSGSIAFAALEFDNAERQAWSRAQAYVRAVGLSTTGGVLVPAQLDPTILLTNTGTSGAAGLRQAFTVKPTTSNVLTTVTSAGVSATYAAEFAEVADGTPTLGTLSVTVFKGHAWVPFSVEVEQDAVGDFTSEMARLLLDGKDRAEAAAFVNGTGTNQPWGIAARLVQAAKTVATATADVVVLADIYGLKAAVPARWRAGGAWLANDITVDRIRRTSETLTGSSNALVESLSDANPSRLLGRPLYETTELEYPGQTAAAGNDEVAIFGDLKQYVIADRIGAVIEYVPMTFGAAGRPTGTRGYYLWWRNGGDLAVPDAARVLRA